MPASLCLRVRFCEGSSWPACLQRRRAAQSSETRVFEASRGGQAKRCNEADMIEMISMHHAAMPADMTTAPRVATMRRGAMILATMHLGGQITDLEVEDGRSSAGNRVASCPSAHPQFRFVSAALCEGLVTQESGAFACPSPEWELPSHAWKNAGGPADAAIMLGCLSGWLDQKSGIVPCNI